MSTPDYLPSPQEATSPEELSNEQTLLADTAREQVQAFLESPTERSHDAAGTALAALEGAVDAHVSVDALSAALETSPEAVQAIVDHDIDLEDLHPDNNTD